MDDTSKLKTPLWMRLTLLISLALNVLVIGAVIGFVLTGGPEKRAERDRSDFGSFYTRALSDEDRRALRRDFMNGLERQGRDRTAFIADMRATVDTLRAQPFNPEAFVSALSEQSTQRARREEMGQRVLANRVAAMSDAERAAYADRIEDRLTSLSERMRR